MTWEELIAKAEEHAKAAGIPIDRLHRPKVRETALVTFVGHTAASRARFHLDATTGELIGTEYSGPEFKQPESIGRQFPFSTRAQWVLAHASDESKRVGSDHVGSDHLLLGLLTYGTGTGASVLLSAGLTADAVRDRIRAIGSTAEVASGGYGPSIVNVLRLAFHKAQALGDPEIEPEHLVLGLLDRVDGPAMSLLRHFNVDTATVKASLTRLMSQKAS